MAVDRSWTREDGDPMRSSLESEHEDGELHSFRTVDNSALLGFEDDHNIRLLSRRSSIAYLPGDSDPEAQVPTLAPTGEPVAGGRDVTYAKAREGLWKRQMLVDRSLRGMALLTMIFALVMMIVCAITYAQESKTLASSDCNSVTVLGQVIHLFINIAATMVLGMSNTYQQLVTSLSVDDIKWALRKSGDARVGTNSPFSIRFKSKGRRSAWMAWILLISTSLPVHLLANSVVGPAYEFPPLPATQYNLVTESPQALPINPSSQNLDSICFIAAASGYIPYHSTEGLDALTGYEYDVGIPASFDVAVYYASNFTEYCGFHVKSTSVSASLQYYISHQYNMDNCSSTYACVVGSVVEPQCGLNVRVEAALILAICLLLKGLYMTFLNIKAYRRTKTQCITFGDVIVASAIDPNLRVHNECMVNAGEAYRREVKHTCHKHCRDKMLSTSGDGLGHCQKCSKHNTINKAPDLPIPVMSTKYKKSLLSNLGTTSLVQIVLLMFCAMTMLAFSLMIAVFIGTERQTECDIYRGDNNNLTGCGESLSQFIANNFGGFGGFNTSVILTMLPTDEASSEMVSFWISNGAQLVFSLLYLLLIYNITLISMEYDWGMFEKNPNKLRCTLVKGSCFRQSYTLQLPKRILLPAMGVSALMHWLLGQSISTVEVIWQNSPKDGDARQAIYYVVYAVYPVWLSTVLIIAITSTCWWAFTYTREGFMPQMYGSIRVCCAATSKLDDFRSGLVKWGDLGEGEKFRHAGFSADPVDPIVPAELYA